jgi:hypothetical protein
MNKKHRWYWVDENGNKTFIDKMNTDHIVNALCYTKRKGHTKIYHLTQGNTTWARVLKELEDELERRDIVMHPNGFRI